MLRRGVGGGTSWRVWFFMKELSSASWDCKKRGGRGLVRMKASEFETGNLATAWHVACLAS
jgi:hypothetical protein